MFERYNDTLLPQNEYYRRLINHFGIAFAITCFSLLAGVLGYRLTEGMEWVDALLNASMILGGMGPVGELHTTSAKLFASVYALYSGLVVLAIAGVLAAPVVHRFLHEFHLSVPEEEEGQ